MWQSRQRSGAGSLRDVVRCFYEAASDAATDSVPPGLGGFMHGMYWQLTLTTEHLRWLHVTVLEMLATGFSAIIFDSHVPGDARLALHSDSAPAVYSLTPRQRAQPRAPVGPPRGCWARTCSSSPRRAPCLARSQGVGTHRGRRG